MALKFKAKLSPYSIMLTLLCNLLILSVCYAMLFDPEHLRKLKQPPVFVKNFIAIALPLIFLLAYLLHPRGYVLNDSSIIIKRHLSNIVIPLPSILEIRPVEYEKLALRIRLFGSGGIWGYFGIFHSNYFGVVNVQASNLKEVVFISTNKKKIYLISPHNAQEFINSVYSNLRHENN